MKEEAKLLPPSVEEPEKEQNSSAIRSFWEEIVNDFATQMSKFFLASKDTLELISSKIHMIMIMYLLFLSTLFVAMCFYVFMTLAITIGMSYKLMMLIVCW